MNAHESKDWRDWVAVPVILTAIGVGYLIDSAVRFTQAVKDQIREALGTREADLIAQRAEIDRQLQEVQQAHSELEATPVQPEGYEEASSNGELEHMIAQLETGRCA